MLIDPTNSLLSDPSDPLEINTGARLQFVEGDVTLVSAVQPPPGWVPAFVSIVSLGTELRQLAATRNGLARKAGYMTLGILSGGGDDCTRSHLLLAPVPHGASFRSDHPRALSLNVDASCKVAVAIATVGRFQLMAALHLNRIAHAGSLDDAVIVGSGPVAMGCALEMRRLGAERMRVVTRRQHPPIAEIPGVTTVTDIEPRTATVVIDCVGRPDIGIEAVAPDGILGLLGTPCESTSLSALHIHRAGLQVIGMHELVNYHHTQYQKRYEDVTRWLAMAIGPELVCRWCVSISGVNAADLFYSLLNNHRPSAPFLLLEWSA